jgi:large subunit ribosomal protein L10
MEGKVIDQAEVAKIASLPTLQEARAKIVGVLNASAQKIVGILLAQSKKMASLAPAEDIKK